MTECLTLTEAAERDLIEIYLYGVEHFGLQCAETYAEVLTAKFDILAQNPSFGVDYSYIRDGLRRSESKSHAIYYRQTDTGILVLRILHSRMDPARHL